MAMEFETSDEKEIAEGSNFLKEPGTYHCAINLVDESPTTKDGKAIEAIAKVTLHVLAGTTEGQANKQFALFLRAPKLNAKDGGKMARRKLTRFLLATGLMTEDQLGQKISTDIQQARGRQLVVCLEKTKSDDGKEYLDLHFDDLWHVDHPDAKPFPKDAAALGLLPASLRRKPESFKQPAAAGPNGNGSAGGAAGGQKTVPAFNLDNL